MDLNNKPAPQFSAVDQNGQQVNLTDYKGKKNVVLFFYPGDFTPVCTKEACHFRDQSEELGDDVQILGISKDSKDSHVKFARAYKLNYPLLSDPGAGIAGDYGLNRMLSFLPPKRTTFVIDKEGIVRAQIHKELDYKGHFNEAKKALDKLS